MIIFSLILWYNKWMKWYIIGVITLCGSLKYQSEMMRMAESLSLKDAHFKRIDLSDAIYVVNKDKYIGNSTKKEIEYAKSLNKKIIYMK